MFIFVPQRMTLSVNDPLKSPTFFIGGKPIEFVDSFSTLGHLINNKLTDSSDVWNNRVTMLAKVIICYDIFCKFTSFVKNILRRNPLVLVSMGVISG